MSGHTPGPWSNHGGFDISADCGVSCVAVTVSGKYPSGEYVKNKEQFANSLLIASAPELLAAAKCALADLEGIMPEFDPDGSEHPGWKTTEELRAAINKAEGRGE